MISKQIQFIALHAQFAFTNRQSAPQSTALTRWQTTTESAEGL